MAPCSFLTYQKQYNFRWEKTTKGLVGVEKITKMCKALGDESRIRLLALLLQRPYCVKALAHQVNLSPSAVSQHLKILKEAYLVKGDRQGYWVHYSVHQEGIKDLMQGLEDFFLTQRPVGGCCKKKMEERLP